MKQYFPQFIITLGSKYNSLKGLSKSNQEEWYLIWIKEEKDYYVNLIWTN